MTENSERQSTQRIVDPSQLETFLPELFDEYARGVFLNTHAYVRVELFEDATVYAPSNSDTATVQSVGYGTSDNKFSGDFERWKPRQLGDYEKRAMLMFLSGFPRLIIDEQIEQPVDAMHVWGDNSSVFDDTFAVPIFGIKSLAVYSRLRLDFEVDRQEYRFGDRDARFQIPYLHDAKNNRTYYRTPTHEEEDDIRGNIDTSSPPVNIWGSFPRRHHFIVTTGKDWIEKARATIQAKYSVE